MARIVLVHGFNVRDGGAHTIDRLAAPLEALGHEVDKDCADYGWHFFFSVRFRHGKDVRRIAAALVDADIVMTHSNGANYTHKALRLLHKTHPEKYLDVVHFAPALDRDAPIPAAVNSMVVFASPHDEAIRMAAKLWFHSWGDMGRVGYTGFHSRVITRLEQNVFQHSGWFISAPHYVNLALQILGWKTAK